MKNNFTDKYFYLTTYYVSSETDTESDSIYDGNEFNRAKLEFDSANISDFKSDYGGTILFRKKVDKYKFVGDLENGEYEISDFPFEDYYNDSDYYQLIEEGEYEYVDSKEINPINKYSEDLLIDVQHHYKNIYGNIKYNNIVVDNGKDFYDDDYKEYGCIQLRIADHSENVKNIDKFGDCDYYISVVIADKDNTKGKFSTSIFERRMNEVELKFNSDNTFDEVISKIENAITEAKEYIIDKNKMKLLAPNGKPSNLTPEQYKLVRTKAFKDWFGDWENAPANASKVVDENGEPLPVYHGTFRDFTKFDISKVGNIDKGFFSKGFYFTPNRDLAYEYGNKLYACFLDIKNPIRTKSRKDLANYLGLEYNNNAYSEIARNKIISLNNDGVLQEYNLPIGAKSIYPFIEIVAYYPNQIKLADGTNTTFDANNDDIRFMSGGNVGGEKEIIAYHGTTNKGFGSYKYKYYTTDYNYAKEYAEDRGRVEQVRINFNNPFVINERYMGYGEIVLDDEIIGFYRELQNDAVEKLKNKGYDIIIVNYKGVNGFEVIPFNKSQVSIIDTNVIYKNGGLIAPNGKPSNLTPEQYRLVRTPAFKKWFGDWENSPETASKVVDENGEPLVVYHGTDKDFTIFDKSRSGELETIKGVDRKIGIYFSNKKQIARFYTKNKGKILELFLNVRNPLKASKLELSTFEIEFFKELGNDGIIWNRGSGMYVNGKPIPLSKGEKAEIEYIVFEPEQIKLADGTNTTFDGKNPDIRYESGGNVYSKIKYKIEPTSATKISLQIFYNNKFSGDLTTETPYLKDKNGYVELVGIGINNTELRGIGLGEMMMKKMLTYLKSKGVIGIKSINQGDYSDKNGRTEAAKKMWARLRKSKKFSVSKKGEDFKIKLADGTNTTFDSSNPDIRYAGGGRLSKTPAPKKDRIYGSKINKPFSASSSEKAKSIKLDDKVIKSIKNILKEHNSKEGSIKIPLSTAKAVVRRGMGAYSVSHRPTISKGKKNSRVAWGLARLKAFIYKVEKGKSKSGKYIQDDDLINELSNKLEYGGRVKASEFVLIDKNINKEELNAIEDVLLLDKFSKLDKDEAIFIYNQFKDYEKNVDEYGDYQIDFLLPIDDSEKEKEIKDFLEVIENNDFLYFDTWEEKLSATNKTTDFINSVRARLETIRLRKQGSDLFPEVESEKIQKRNALEAIESLKIMKELEPEKASVYDEAIEGLIAYSETIFDNGGQAEIKSENHEKFHLVYEGQKPIAKMKFDLSESNIDTITKKIDELTDRGYKIKQVSEDDFNSFSYSKVDPNDLRKFMQGIEYFKVGGKIEFDKNDLPNKNIYKYALNIKKNYPEIWKKGGNIFGNQAFENLERVIKRGYWLDSEAWMYVKWRAYVARHQRDYRIEGVIAMLKWIDEVERGWAYMKDLIEKYKSKYKKMNEGGEIKETEFVIVYTEKGLSFDFNVSKDLKLDEVVSICKQKSYPDKLNYFIWKGEKYKIQKI